jgi:small subunit ribosomal protein S1
LKQLTEDPWETRIPEKYQPNQLVKGTVTKITNFGVFISLEDDLEGLLHISELANHKVENPEDIVKVGEEIEVKILRVDPEERKIGLSRKRAEWTEEEEAAAAAEEQQQENSEANISPELLKGGVGSSESGPLFKPSAQE